MNNKISIITPVFNAKKYLKRCIDSQINQTYTNIEIILVDDGSNDGSEEICNQYQTYDKRIKVIHKANEGVSTARNEGIKIASGEWILFVDADDFLEKDTCEKYIEILYRYKKKVDVIVATCNIIKDGRIEKAITKYDEKMLTDSDKKNLINSIFVNTNEYFSYVETPWAKLYRTDFLKRNKVNFKPGLHLGEDINFNFKALYYASTIIFSTQIVYNYNVYNNSTSHKFMENIVKQFDLMYEELEKNSFILKFKKEYNYFVIRQLKKLEKEYFFNKCNKRKYIKKEYISLISRHPYKETIKEINIGECNGIKKKIYIILLKIKFYELIKLWNYK